MQCQRARETSVVLIVFGGFLCEFHTYTVTVLTVAQHESGTRKAISLVSDRI